MATFEELRKEAEMLMKKEEFEEALPLYNELYSLEKNEWNGYFLAKCLRKTEDFYEARELHKEISKNYPGFKPIKNEELWLDYSEKIKNWKNDNLLEDAEVLLSKTDKYDKFTGSIYNKTILSVVKNLIYNNKNEQALEWLDKLDFTLLSNAPFTYQGIKYPSDLKQYFIRYADVLIKLKKHIDYLESYLSVIGFEEKKQMQFKNKIIEEITFEDYISRVKLALYLKYFKEEIHNRKKNSHNKIYNPSKITLISDIADFEFCPVSFAINETYNIPSNTVWEKDEWLGEKRFLLNRHKDFNENKDLAKAFSDSSIEINDKLNNDFNDIFTAKLIGHNYDGADTKYYSNPTGTIRGNPDYVFENNGNKFAVVEKFTKRTSEKIETPFLNDLLKIYGYLFELQSLELSYGYFIYWYWQLEDVYDKKDNINKKIKIKAYRIFKMEKTKENRDMLNNVISKVTGFKNSKKYHVDGDRISHPNKCLHCSAISYCNHKTGLFNEITLPYDINAIKIKST